MAKKKPAYLHNTVATFAVNLDEVLETYKDHRRLCTFYYKGRKCVSCGIEGDRIVLWYDWHWKPLEFAPPSRGLHTDLLAGNMLMTVDHIKPKSLGGPDCLENYQPMCANCNNAKADKWDGSNEHLVTRIRTGDCCCIKGDFPKEMGPEFPCDNCPVHPTSIMRGGRLCRRHKALAS